MILRYLLTTSIVTLIASQSFAGPSVGKPRIDLGLKSKTTDRNGDKIKSKEETPLEHWERSQAETSTLSKLQLSREQMKALVREFRGNPSEYGSFQRLIKSAPQTKTTEDIALLKNYFQLLAHSNGEFHLSPSIIEERIRSWSPTTKEHLATILEASVQAAREEKAILREEAFESALKKYGLDTEYRKKCRRP